MNNLYIRFLNTIDALGRANPGRSLDSTEIQLLEYILLATDKGQTLLVGDLIHLSEFGSQATLHGRIKNLASVARLLKTPDHEICAPAFSRST